MYNLGLYLEVYEPKWINSIINKIGVNSLWLVGIHINIQKIYCYTFMSQYKKVINIECHVMCRKPIFALLSLQSLVVAEITLLENRILSSQFLPILQVKWRIQFMVDVTLLILNLTIFILLYEIKWRPLC